MYTVHGQDGTILMQSAMDFRYDAKTELALLNSGHTIRLNGKRISKKEVMQNAECNQHHGKNFQGP